MVTNPVLDVLNQNNSYAKVCAPMVRYSKLNFRSLVRNYDVDLCFTPMIIADSFIKSSKARNSEFSTSPDDTPLIVQFAANNSQDFVAASQYISPFSNGVDLNCGCPQRWAIKEGLGCALLSKPEIISSCIKEIHNTIPSNDFTVSVKVRLMSSIDKSILLCQQLEKCGVSFLTVHARTAVQKHEPIDMDSLKFLKENLHIPIIANGDIKTLEDADRLYEYTNCNGIMSARGILKNPTLFTGESRTSLSCIEEWISMEHSHFMTFHHHLVFMCDKLLNGSEKDHLSSLNNGLDVLDFLNNKFDIESRCRNCFENLVKGSKDEGKFFKEEVSTITKEKNNDLSEDFLENSVNIFQ